MKRFSFVVLWILLTHGIQAQETKTIVGVVLERSYVACPSSSASSTHISTKPYPENLRVWLLKDPTLPESQHVGPRTYTRNGLFSVTFNKNELAGNTNKLYIIGARGNEKVFQGAVALSDEQTSFAQAVEVENLAVGSIQSVGFAIARAQEQYDIEKEFGSAPELAFATLAMTVSQELNRLPSIRNNEDTLREVLGIAKEELNPQISNGLSLEQLDIRGGLLATRIEADRDRRTAIASAITSLDSGQPVETATIKKILEGQVLGSDINPELLNTREFRLVLAKELDSKGQTGQSITFSNSGTTTRVVGDYGISKNAFEALIQRDLKAREFLFYKAFANQTELSEAEKQAALIQAPILYVTE